MTAAVVLAALCSTRDASARDTTADVYLRFDAKARFYRQTPDLYHPETTTLLRFIPEGEVPAAGGMAALGVAGDVGFVLDDRYLIPTFGLGAAGTVGSRDRVLTSADGSVVELRPWTSFMIEVLLPGVGVRFKERRWLFNAQARLAVAHVQMSARIAQGRDWSDISAFRTQAALRGEIGACRRIDPLERLCLVVEPHLYEFSWMNGASIALRWEMGP